MPKYKFFNIPKRYSLSDYDSAISYIIKRYSGSKGLVSAYSWGVPSVPGISDIDILLVFKNHAAPLSFRKRSFYALDSRSRYLVRHPFVFMDEESFGSIKYIYPKPNLELLHGKNIRINAIPKRDFFYSEISLFNDIIIRHYPRDFLEQSIRGKINVRDTLLRLNSLKYSVSLMKSIAKEKRGNWDGLIEDVKKLRQNWFVDSDFELLASLNSRAVYAALEMTEAFAKFLKENAFISIVSGDSAKYSGIKNRTVFVKDWKIKQSLREMSGSIAKKQKFFEILPLELAPQLFEYSREKGRISRHIRANISGNMQYRIKHRTAIKKRIGVLNSQAELALKLRHSDFPAFFDFGYRNKSGLNNILLNLLDYFRF